MENCPKMISQNLEICYIFHLIALTLLSHWSNLSKLNDNLGFGIGNYGEFVWKPWNYYLFICLIIFASIRLRTLWSKASKREGGVSMTTLVEHSFAESTESTLWPKKLIWLVVTWTCRLWLLTVLDCAAQVWSY